MLACIGGLITAHFVVIFCQFQCSSHNCRHADGLLSASIVQCRLVQRHSIDSSLSDGELCSLATSEVTAFLCRHCYGIGISISTLVAAHFVVLFCQFQCSCHNCRHTDSLLSASIREFSLVQRHSIDGSLSNGELCSLTTSEITAFLCSHGDGIGISISTLVAAHFVVLFCQFQCSCHNCRHTDSLLSARIRKFRLVQRHGIDGSWVDGEISCGSSFVLAYTRGGDGRITWICIILYFKRIICGHCERLIAQFHGDGLRHDGLTCIGKCPCCRYCRISNSCSRPEIHGHFSTVGYTLVTCFWYLKRIGSLSCDIITTGMCHFQGCIKARLSSLGCRARNCLDYCDICRIQIITLIRLGRDGHLTCCGIRLVNSNRSTCITRFAIQLYYSNNIISPNSCRAQHQGCNSYD